MHKCTAFVSKEKIEKKERKKTQSLLSVKSRTTIQFHKTKHLPVYKKTHTRAYVYIHIHRVEIKSKDVTSSPVHKAGLEASSMMYNHGMLLCLLVLCSRPEGWVRDRTTGMMTKRRRGRKRETGRKKIYFREHDAGWKMGGWPLFQALDARETNGAGVKCKEGNDRWRLTIARARLWVCACSVSGLTGRGSIPVSA